MKEDILKAILGDGGCRDLDIAQFCLAKYLGLIDSEMDFWNSKHHFWTKDPIGDATYALIKAFESTGDLVVDDMTVTRTRVI